MSDNYFERERASRNLTFLEPDEMTIKELKEAIKKDTELADGLKELINGIMLKVEGAKKELQNRNKLKIIAG